MNSGPRQAATANLRYLSRFETSNPKLFELLHSAPGNHEKNLARRFQCFKYLRECGYQLGTGVMIGIPGQTSKTSAATSGSFSRLTLT